MIQLNLCVRHGPRELRDCRATRGLMARVDSTRRTFTILAASSIRRRHAMFQETDRPASLYPDPLDPRAGQETDRGDQ